ncbi:hypothetical protein DEU56DRAFT_755525 [Suillus clintonianus]|uniref:uncharacterized protein n=1 Tax=Suillus clintonianus TaxID=1904413 RepID=UPI001B862FB9|nr:uncharacterized protein DEU56DRAFT_755525 [Suillus clintonianus]KAG2139777.1 hypothetical protein DEU56DRAFT_755525 [Suillus clintonianus]
MVLAAFATQMDNTGPSNQPKDPWTVNPSDTVPTVEPAQHNPRKSIDGQCTPANIDMKLMSTKELCTLRKCPLPPPPPAITTIGYPVDIIGKVMTFHGGWRITAISMKGCNSTNDQWKHVVTVVGLHKSKYVASRPSTFIMPDQFLHPSQLWIADITDNTFQLYLKHHIHNAPGNVCDITSPAFTLSHLCRIPKLALLASRVVHAKMRQCAQPHAHAAQTCNSNLLRVRMKHLFMWVILQLYEEGSIVLCNKPLMSITSCNTQQCVTSDDEAYISDPPPLEEDKAYIPVTATLLSQPVQEIMSARGI